jgi:hypothetical protein
MLAHLSMHGLGNPSGIAIPLQFETTCEFEFGRPSQCQSGKSEISQVHRTSPRIPLIQLGELVLETLLSALRPGRCLLTSSHFMPLPRNWMMRAPASGDYLYCFLTRDWKSVMACLFAGLVGPRAVGAGPVPTVVAGLAIAGTRDRGASIPTQTG